MDLEFNEQQQMLKASAREFFERECPTTLVRACEESEEGYSPDLWNKMAKLGWLGMMLPPEYDGLGGTFADLAALFEEMGRFAVPSPFANTVVLCGIPILEAGNPDQKKSFLPRLAAGEAIMALALTEASATYTPEGVEVSATRDGTDFIINGTKLFIEDAHIADYLLCVVRTNQTPKASEDGITLLIVDTTSPGISISPLHTTALDKQFEVTFNNVRVAGDNLLGKVDQGWPIIQETLKKAIAMQCAEMIGGAEHVLEMTVMYVNNRVQFGRPIGSFQSVQHTCADMVINIDNARLATYQAIYLLDSGLPAEKEIAMAKAWTSPTYKKVTQEAHQLHGGMGYMLEYDLHLWSRRAKSMELKFGVPDDHLEIFAKAIGL
jgi:alkylation response protein AidB-like acyl-CoA dehydrogenase